MKLSIKTIAFVIFAFTSCWQGMWGATNAPDIEKEIDILLYNTQWNLFDLLNSEINEVENPNAPGVMIAGRGSNSHDALKLKKDINETLSKIKKYFSIFAKEKPQESASFLEKLSKKNMVFEKTDRVFFESINKDIQELKTSNLKTQSTDDDSDDDDDDEFFDARDYFDDEEKVKKDKEALETALKNINKKENKLIILQSLKDTLSFLASHSDGLKISDSIKKVEEFLNSLLTNTKFDNFYCKNLATDHSADPQAPNWITEITINLFKVKKLAAIKFLLKDLYKGFAEFYKKTDLFDLSEAEFNKIVNPIPTLQTKLQELSTSMQTVQKNLGLLGTKLTKLQEKLTVLKAV